MKPGNIAIASLALVAAACSGEPEGQEEAAAPTVHEVMSEKIDLIADEVWEVGNSAIGPDAGLDPAEMDEEKWNNLEESATRLALAARELSHLDPLVLVKPGVTIADEDVEGGTTSTQVQANIDAEPQKFRDMAEVLSLHMEDLAKTARERDYVRAGPLINQLDGVCESCHLEFWYPSQKEMVEEIMRKGEVRQGPR